MRSEVRVILSKTLALFESGGFMMAAEGPGPIWETSREPDYHLVSAAFPAALMFYSYDHTAGKSWEKEFERQRKRLERECRKAVIRHLPWGVRWIRIGAVWCPSLWYVSAQTAIRSLRAALKEHSNEA